MWLLILGVCEMMPNIVKPTKILIIAILLVSCLSVLAFGDEALNNVVGVEVGYGYAVSQTDLQAPISHGIVTSLYYGYVVHDKPQSMTILSLAIGYEVFPAEPATLHSLVYGPEFGHIFFRQSPVSLLVDYGLLFNLILQSGRDGYAFGHHTRLGIGGVFNLSEQHKLTAKVSYNMITFPYYEQASTKFSFPAIQVRYSFLY